MTARQIGPDALELVIRTHLANPLLIAPDMVRVVRRLDPDVPHTIFGQWNGTSITRRPAGACCCRPSCRSRWRSGDDSIHGGFVVRNSAQRRFDVCGHFLPASGGGRTRLLAAGPTGGRG